jgi:hypothetical protein
MHVSWPPYWCGCSGAGVGGELDFLLYNVCVVFGDRVFRKSVRVRVGAGCAPLSADLFLYSNEAEFVQRLLRNGDKKLAMSFGHACGYAGGVLSVGGHGFHRCIHLVCPDGLGMRV